MPRPVGARDGPRLAWLAGPARRLPRREPGRWFRTPQCAFRRSRSCVAALGGLLLAAATAEGPGVDALRFLVSTRPGLLVAARVGVAVAGAVVAGLLLRRGRVGAAASVAGAAGGAGLVLMAFDGHAAAGPSASLVSMVVHLGAAATWLSGVLALAWIAAPRGAAGSVARGEYLRAAVPRFSALALVSVALVALTGLVQEWMLARSFVPLGTQYGAALVAKTLIFAVALIFGALNFLDGGRGRPSQADLRRRLLAEAALAIGVLVAAANLASGSPPASQAAAEIERAPSSAVATMPIDLQILPGRPGPNRLDVVLPPRADPLISIDLVLQRLDSSVGPARYELRRLAGSTLDSLSPGDHFVVDGGLLPPDSRWDATAVLLAPDGSELTRQRFAFALDGQGIVEGKSVPPLDPALIIAGVLLAASILGLAFVLAGRRPATGEPGDGQAGHPGGRRAGHARRGRARADRRRSLRTPVVPQVSSIAGEPVARAGWVLRCELIKEGAYDRAACRADAPRQGRRRACVRPGGTRRPAATADAAHAHRRPRRDGRVPRPGDSRIARQ